MSLQSSPSSWNGDPKAWRSLLNCPAPRYLWREKTTSGGGRALRRARKEKLCISGSGGVKKNTDKHGGNEDSKDRLQVRFMVPTPWYVQSEVEKIGLIPWRDISRGSTIANSTYDTSRERVLIPQCKTVCFWQLEFSFLISKTTHKNAYNNLLVCAEGTNQ